MRPILLDARAATGCAHRAANDHDPNLHPGKANLSLVEQRRMAAGRQFEDDVVTALAESLGDRLADLRDTRDPHDTLAAMNRRVDVVVGGRLPDDLTGGRTGIPDLLIHTGAGKYLPGDIKWHKVVGPAGKRANPAPISLPAAPAHIYAEMSLKPLGKELWPDLAQLAHYTRMLQAAGYHPGGQPLAALIGRPLTAGEDLHLTWYDLDASLGINTEPADDPAASVLEAYDARHALRLAAASGSATTVPVRCSACDTCRWAELCRTVAGPDDASWTLRRDTLKPRDWLALRDAGITTTGQLATLDVLDPAWTTAFAPHSSAPKADKALELLADAAERAEMIVSGQTLRRTTTGFIDVPAADVEVDVDLEWDMDGRVYLWAGTVRRGPHLAAGERGQYVHFSHFEAMTEEVERELAWRFADWLDRILEKAAARDRTVTVFHYTHPERTHLVRVLGEDAGRYLEHYVDLFEVVKTHLTGAWGLSIKKVAPHFGFQWRDEDPGGLQSQDWLLMAREAADPAARQDLARRILAYNEDDVRAQVAIRDGLRAEHGPNLRLVHPRGA